MPEIAIHLMSKEVALQLGTIETEDNVIIHGTNKRYGSCLWAKCQFRGREDQERDEKIRGILEACYRDINTRL